MILYSRPIIEEKTYDLKDFFITQKSAYITILLFGDDKGSMIYVKNKIKYGGEIWCNVRVIKDEDFKSLKGKDLVNKISRCSYSFFTSMMIKTVSVSLSNYHFLSTYKTTNKNCVILSQ